MDVDRDFELRDLIYNFVEFVIIMTQSNSKRADILAFQDHKLIKQQLKEVHTSEGLYD